MSIDVVNGTPVAIDERRTIKGRVRIHVKKKSNELGIKKLPLRQRQALENLMKMGTPYTNAKKIKAAEMAGYKDSHGNTVPQTMNRLLSRKPIVDEIERVIKERHEKTTDEKIAEVIVDGLDANHPLSKEDKPDHHARAKFVREANMIADNYPPKKIQEDKRVLNIHLTGDDYKQIKKAEEMRRLHESEPDPNPFR